LIPARPWLGPPEFPQSPSAWLSSLRCGRALALAGEPMKATSSARWYESSIRRTNSDITDDFAPEKSPKPLISNDPKKRRNHRQNSSKLVKTLSNRLIPLAFQ
jgi:hypothetical protein